MNIKIFLTIVAAILMMAACTNKNEVVSVADIAGTYSGYSDADCAYFQDKYTDGESAVITANSDGTVAVSYKSATWGTFEVASATVTKNGDIYAISGASKVTMGMGESTTDYDFTLAATTTAAKDTYSIVYTVPSVMGGLTITLLPGVAPAAE